MRLDLLWGEPVYVLIPVRRRHKPVYFEEDISSGKPSLSEEGKRAVKAELERAREG